MSVVGYARVSTTGQSLEVQREQLLAAGAERIFEEKRSGTTTAGRDALELALGYVRDGDVFLVTRLDRLARSVTDLRTIVDRLTAKGVGFRALQQGALDTTQQDSMSRLLLNILASFAEFEADIRRERQMEGIARAKAEGVYRGRKPTVPEEEIRRLHQEEGLKPAEIVRRLGVGRSSVFRALGPAAERRASG